MKYITTYVRAQGEGAPSLVLQQFRYRNIPVCFACILWDKDSKASGTARRLSENMKIWADSADWVNIIRRGQRNPDLILEALAEELLQESVPQGLGECVCYGLLLGIRSRFAIRGSGMYFYALASFYGGGRLKSLKAQGNLFLEAGAGLLLSCEEIDLQLFGDRIRECFRPDKIREEEGAGKHLREFAGQLQMQKSTSTMLLLLTKNEVRIEEDMII